MVGISDISEGGSMSVAHWSDVHVYLRRRVTEFLSQSKRLVCVGMSGLRASDALMFLGLATIVIKGW